MIGINVARLFNPSIQANVGVPPNINNLQNGLQAYYKFDENTGTTIHDATGNGNTGTLSAGGLWTNGIIGSGVNFVNSNSVHVDIPSFNNIINYSAITVQAWWNPTFVGGSDRLVTNSHTDSDNNGFQLMNNGGNQMFFMVGNGSMQVNSQANFVSSTGVWYHLLGTYDGANVIFYINGSGQTPAALTGNIALSLNDLWISGNPAYNGDYAHGIIDEVAIWNRALTPLEVTLLYNGGAGLQYPF